MDQREVDFLKARSEAIRGVKCAIENEGMDMPEPIYRVQLTSTDRDSEVRVVGIADVPRWPTPQVSEEARPDAGGRCVRQETDAERPRAYKDSGPQVWRSAPAADANPYHPEGIASMKASILFVAISACVLASMPLASAQDQDVPQKPSTDMRMEEHASQMQANMTKMKSQMDEIRKTTDPEVRQALMQAHMQTMQESMAMMGQMHKPGMMAGGQAAGTSMGGDKGMMGGNMMQRHQMMENRVGMMQMMLEQMLQHLQAMESMPAR